MPSGPSLILGFISLGVVVWLSLELRRATATGEIRLFRLPGGEFADRRSRPIFFWAMIGWTVFVVLISSLVAIGLLFGVELRWWL
ncbi:hypothetical protein [Brevundimonas sp. Root1423]|uniref:hypothetical protein n=1 Tax=Brevundimonas sp. Root1423 TaxID=1736462 RepID=UPI000B100A3B|nr:hypothetical protein [Brevundimonas sp. Root1423]